MVGRKSEYDRSGENLERISDTDRLRRSDGTTVLGSDDAAGLTAILEALTVIREQKLPHPQIEVLFSVEEELYSRGLKDFSFDELRSPIAYVLDLTGKIGTAAVSAPSILSLEITVTGKAAHAGFSPEEGINALTITARALSSLQTGHVEPDTTVNFGTVSGGSGKNIVPAEVRIQGEIRSLRHERALSAAEQIRLRFEEEAEKLSGQAEVLVTEELRAYRVGEDAPVVRRFRSALESLGYGAGDLITTFGGSDNNRFQRAGISGIVLACAMENVHSVHEYSDLRELQRSAELTLRLMIMEDET